MDDSIRIEINKKYVDFIAKPTKTKTRSYFHIPANLIKFNQVDLEKRYRVILIPIDDDKSEKKN